MRELMGNAWRGWLEFTDQGKLCALLLASLVFLWVYYKRADQKNLLIYTSVMTGFCILPVTAAALMMYQTKFYDYQWIWSLVPMTLVTAEAATVLLAKCWPDFPGSGWKKGLPAALFLLGILGLSAGLGIRAGNSGNAWNQEAEAEERLWAEETLEQVRNRFREGEICLWAPREIMEYARETDSQIRLLYGRNMWDPSLNAFSYDTFYQQEVSLAVWMSNVPETGGSEGGADCAQAVLEAGVNCILLPEEAEEETVSCFEKILGVRAEKIPGYYLLVV